MKNVKKIYVEQTAFSSAMIELKLHTKTLFEMDMKLERPNQVLKETISLGQSSQMVDYLKKYALEDFYQAQKVLLRIKKDVMQYTQKLDKFLQENPKSHQEFYEQLDILIPLWEEKHKFVKSQLEKSNEYIKQNQEISV